MSDLSYDIAISLEPDEDMDNWTVIRVSVGRYGYGGIRGSFPDPLPTTRGDLPLTEAAEQFLSYAVLTALLQARARAEREAQEAREAAEAETRAREGVAVDAEDVEVAK